MPSSNGTRAFWSPPLGKHGPSSLPRFSTNHKSNPTAGLPKTFAFVITVLDKELLDIIILISSNKRETKSERESQTSCIHVYVESEKSGTDSLIYKAAEIETQMWRTDVLYQIAVGKLGVR